VHCGNFQLWRKRERKWIACAISPILGSSCVCCLPTLLFSPTVFWPAKAQKSPTSVYWTEKIFASSCCVLGRPLVLICCTRRCGKYNVNTKNNC